MPHQSGAPRAERQPHSHLPGARLEARLAAALGLVCGTVLALASALWSVVASLVGALRHREDFVRSAEGAVYATAIATTVAAVSLLAALATTYAALKHGDPFHTVLGPKI